MNQYKKIKFSSQLINLLIKSLPFIHSERGGGASLEGAFGPLQAHTPTPYPLESIYTFPASTKRIFDVYLPSKIGPNSQHTAETALYVRTTSFKRSKFDGPRST
jgi:hypothetical protein